MNEIPQRKFIAIYRIYDYIEYDRIDASDISSAKQKMIKYIHDIYEHYNQDINMMIYEVTDNLHFTLELTNDNES